MIATPHRCPMVQSGLLNRATSNFCGAEDFFGIRSNQ